jgi:hypothetical protein
MKMRHAVALIVLVCATHPAFAQFSQQGPKLLGTGAVENAARGVSVSLSADGNTAIVGGNLDNNAAGAAWVWTRSGGVWTQQGAKLVGSGAVGNAGQGYSVSLSADGNTAIVGGNLDNGAAGAAWIWTRSGGVWAQQGSKLVGSGAIGKAAQGHSVSLSPDGNTAIIGGRSDNNFAGAAWVWTRSGGVWTQQGAKLVGVGAVGDAQQGTSVSLSADGNTALVGGSTDNSQAGAAWVWTRSGGVWTQQGSKLVGSGAAGSAEQGTSVSLSADGNTAIVGGGADNTFSGAAWVWTRNGGVWTQQGAKLVGSGAAGGAEQGHSVSLSADGKTAIIGGNTDNSLAGAAWVWTRTGAVWTQQGTKLVGSGAIGNALQGASVSLSSDGSTVIVGGNLDNGGAGAAWIFAAETCAQGSTTLCLNDNRFAVSAAWRTSDGQSGQGQAVRLTADTGYFTFFSATNVEVVIKVLNACGLNSKYWVFAGGLTDVNVVLTVRDTVTGTTRTYTNPSGTAFQPIQDTDAFTTCSANGSSLTAPFEAPDPRDPMSIKAMAVLPAPTAACAQDSTTICLNGDRFAVTATWRTGDGKSGQGQAVRLTADTGYFTFFSTSNVEVVIKVLDACGLNSRYWVFAGGLTNVNVVLTVRDTATGTLKIYTNPLDKAFQPIQDTSAFATCGPSASTYTLTTSTTGTGSGVISPAGGSYASGAVVTLTATPNTGSTFVGWSGDCSGVSSTCTLTMNSNKSATATFNTLASSDLAVISVSSKTPMPLTSLHIVASGLNPNTALSIRFANSSGYSVTESPISVASSGEISVAVPLYADPKSGQITQGMVSVTLTQGSRSSSPVALTIQDLPSLSTFGTQPGQITHAFLVYEAMLHARRINELQAIQPLVGGVDTSDAQSTLISLQRAATMTRFDVDKIALHPTQSVNWLGGLQFDATQLDLVDRILGVYITQQFATPSVGASGRRLTPLSVSSVLSNMLSHSGMSALVDYVRGTANRTEVARAAGDGIVGLLNESGGRPKAIVGLLTGFDHIATAVDSMLNSISPIAECIATGCGNSQQLIDDMQNRAYDFVSSYAQTIAHVPEVLMLEAEAVTASNIAESLDGFLKTVKLLGDASKAHAVDALLASSNALKSLGRATGHVKVSNALGTAASQTTLNLCCMTSDDFDISDLADPAGNYDMWVPAGMPGTDYRQMTLSAVDDLSGHVLVSATVDLSTLTATSVITLPTMSATCFDDDDDGDDPDCD